MARGKSEQPRGKSGAKGKSKGGGGTGGGGGSSDVRRETPLQAVVLADSFTEATFRPLTVSRPKTLLPLANVPLLEYTLELLASSGVEDVILFVTQHASALERFLARDSLVARRVSVRVVTSTACATAGDALREIDRQQLVQSDPFVLLSGDVVTNVDLPRVLEAHRARKKRDANCIMTTVFTPVSTRGSSSLRPLNEDLVVVLDAHTSQIVLYEDAPSQRSTHLGKVFLEEHAQLTIRTDLLDSGLDICSPEVLLKFAEDFDYQHLRRDFFHNEVQNYELGKKFFAHIVTDAFAARVLDPRTYSGVTRAVLQRWAFPLVPDSNLLGASRTLQGADGQRGPNDDEHADGGTNDDDDDVRPTRYVFQRGMVYRDQGVTLSRSCRVGRECLLGAGVSCGDGTTLERSTLGARCRLGNNVAVTGSYLWEGVVVEDGARITDAIVGENVVVRAGAVVEPGCVLGDGVVVGAGFCVRAFTKLTTAEELEVDDGFSSEEEEEEEEEEKEEEKKEDINDKDDKGERVWDPAHVGVGGVGRVWTLDEDGIEVDSEDEDGDSEDDSTPLQAQRPDVDARRLAKLKTQLMGAGELVVARSQRWETWSTTSTTSTLDGEGDAFVGALDGDPEEAFKWDIHDMVVTGDRAGHATEDSFMEIKSHKFAQNRSFADVLGGVVPGLLDRVSTAEGQSAVAILAQVRATFERWSGIVRQCLVEDGDAAAVVAAVEHYCLVDEHSAVWTPLFRFVLQTAYDLEWVTDEAVLEWHASRAALTDTAAARLATSKEVVAFIEWLEESDDDDDDSDDDEEEDDDDDE